LFGDIYTMLQTKTDVISVKESSYKSIFYNPIDNPSAHGNNIQNTSHFRGRIGNGSSKVITSSKPKDTSIIIESTLPVGENSLYLDEHSDDSTYTYTLPPVNMNTKGLVNGFRVNMNVLPLNYNKTHTNLSFSMFSHITHLVDSSSCHIYTAMFYNTPVVLKLIKVECNACLLLRSTRLVSSVTCLAPVLLQSSVKL
jgi:hypothetical protein